jgi:uncharacterized protein YjiS (DUF1127 family)
VTRAGPNNVCATLVDRGRAAIVVHRDRVADLDLELGGHAEHRRGAVDDLAHAGQHALADLGVERADRAAQERRPGDHVVGRAAVNWVIDTTAPPV